MSETTIKSDTPGPTIADFPGLAVQVKAMFLMLARQMLTCDPFLVLDEEAAKLACELKARGARIGLEIIADERGQARVLLTAVAPWGERCEIGLICEEPSGAPN